MGPSSPCWSERFLHDVLLLLPPEGSAQSHGDYIRGAEAPELVREYCPPTARADLPPGIATWSLVGLWRVSFGKGGVYFAHQRKRGAGVIRRRDYVALLYLLLVFTARPSRPVPRENCPRPVASGRGWASRCPRTVKSRHVVSPWSFPL